MTRSIWTAALISIALISGLGAQELGVVGVARNDVLKIREWPSQSSRVVGTIPYDGVGIRFLGQREGTWLFVRYGDIKGWVGGSFLAREVPRGGKAGPDE